jgi:hypothetical protein
MREIIPLLQLTYDTKFGTLLCVFMYPIGTMSHIDTWIRLSDKQSSGMKLRLAHINGTYVYFFLAPKNVYC